MTMASFEQRQIAARDHLLEQVRAVFARHDAIAIHQLGSLARDEGDALSDLDLWITFADETLPGIVTRREQIYAEVAEVLISYEALQNRPLGGSYRLVVYKAAGTLMQVDYYLAPRSSSIVLPEARLVYGNDAFPRGQWLIDQSVSTPVSTSERIDFLICMSFIGVKKVLRRDEAFIRFLLSQYDQFVETYRLDLRPIKCGLHLDTFERLLGELVQVADERQRRAIDEIIHRYLRLV